jgi:hypothetical protein
VIRAKGVRLAVLLGGEWADLSSHVMTEADIQTAEARWIVREWLGQRRESHHREEQFSKIIRPD